VGFHKLFLRPPGLQTGYYKARCRRHACQPGRHAVAMTNASADAVELVFSHVRLRTPGSKGLDRRQSQAPCSTVASPPHGGSVSLDVGLPSCTILSIETLFGNSSPELLSALAVGSSLQECLDKRRNLTALLLALTEGMAHGTQLNDAEGKGLGTWDLFTEHGGKLLVQLTLTGLEAPSSDVEPDSVVCRLRVQLRPRAAAPGRVVPRSAEATPEAQITLGAKVTTLNRACTPPDLVITACSLQAKVLLGFDPVDHCFTSWLSCPGELFWDWVEVLAGIEPGHATQEAALDFGEITLRPGRLVEHGWEIRSGCTCVILPKEQANRRRSDCLDLLTVELRAARKVRLRQSL